MKWKQSRRSDRYMLVEYACEHGVGHPAYGSALWIAEMLTLEGYPNSVEGQMIHGCDGCCGRDDFPGKPEDSLVFARGMIDEFLGKNNMKMSQEDFPEDPKEALVYAHGMIRKLMEVRDE